MTRFREKSRKMTEGTEKPRFAWQEAEAVMAACKHAAQRATDNAASIELLSIWLDVIEECTQTLREQIMAHKSDSQLYWESRDSE